MCNLTSLAFVNGYKTAEEYTAQTNGYIETANQNDWYKFTLTEDEVPTTYSVSLKIPSSCVYNFDLRYRTANSNERPKIISNETHVNGSRNRRMSGVLTDPGTYYVRIFSQNGTVSTSDNYKIMISYGKNRTNSLGFIGDFPVGVSTDWCICADMMGNHLLEKNLYNFSSNRNYKNASVFIESNYESDDASEYTANKKGTPEETAIATNYIYSGDILLNPKVGVETNKIYTISELANFIWEYDDPIIFFLENPQINLGYYKKYIILDAINIGENTITYYYPQSGNKVTVDYNDFLLNGINVDGVELTYSGTNIVNLHSPRRPQVIYN